MDKLQELLDQEAIRMLTVLYSRAVDTRDWPLYRSIFLDEVHIDFGEFARVGAWDADDWVHNIEAAVAGFDGTQHLNGNHEIRIEGERASSVHYVLAEHCINPVGGGTPGVDDTVTFGGYYNNEYRKTAAGWKIAGIVLTALFLKGNPALFETARKQ